MRVYARIPLVCVAMLLAIRAGAHAQAEIPSRLTLPEALRLASARNPRIAGARAGVDAAAADRITARLRPNPVLTLDSSSYPLFESDRGSFADSQELNVRVDQELDFGARRRLRRQSAERGMTQADASRRDVERQVLLDVRRAYLQAALAQADLATARDTLVEIDRVLTLNRARLQQGEISGAEVRRLHAERLRFVDDVFASELALRNASSSLLTLLNAPNPGQPVEIADGLRLPDADGAEASPAASAMQAAATMPGQPAGLPAPAAGSAATLQSAPAATTPPVVAPAALAELQKQAVASRPDMAAAIEAERRADTQTRLQRALARPALTVGGGYNRNFGTNGISVGMSVPLPFFNRNQGAIARADAEQRQAALERAATQADVALDVQQAANALEVSRARVAYIEREFLDNAEQSVAIARNSYQLGAATLIDLLDAQRTWRETRRTYNRALYDLRISQFQLDAAIGREAVTP
jgi:outer membrane protein, heavy metal efflux system